MPSTPKSASGPLGEDLLSRVSPCTTTYGQTWSGQGCRRACGARRCRHAAAPVLPVEELHPWSVERLGSPEPEHAVGQPGLVGQWLPVGTKESPV